MKKFDFEEDKPPRRKRRDDDYEPRKRIDHIEMAMLILAVSAGCMGGLIEWKAKSIMHELFAGECFIVAAILFVGGMIYGQLVKRERD